MERGVHVSTFIDKAHPYMRFGWYLIPQARNKVPLIKAWPVEASNKNTRLSFWDRQFPDANVAVVTGQRSGVVVIDLDDEKAIERWTELRKVCGMHRDPPTVITRRGVHLYYRSAGGLRSATPSKMGKGIDIRGENGLATLPPSVHESGHVYEWAGGKMPLEQLDNLPSLPPSCLNMLQGLDPFKGKVLKHEFVPTLDKIVDKLRGAPAGGRNRSLYNASFQAGKLVKKGDLPELDAYRHLTSEGIAIGLDRKEVMTTVRSGINDGMKA
jgi:hypothetical protein